MSGDQHSVVLDFVRGLALICERQYVEASWLFEANAHVRKHLGLDEDATNLPNQAKAMRKALNMLPSTVELRRLQMLRTSLR